MLKALAAKQARQEALPVAAVSLSDSIAEEEVQLLQPGQDFFWLPLGYNGLRKEGGGLYCEFCLQEVQDRELYLDSERWGGEGWEFFVLRRRTWGSCWQLNMSLMCKSY